MKIRCASHVFPELWKRAPVPDRPGWERVTCSVCGQIIGENPMKSPKIRQNDDVIATGGDNEVSLGGLFEDVQ